MLKSFNVLMMLAMLFSTTVVFAQYGGSSNYPNCNTCAVGTYLSNNAPTYWNCCGSGALCSYDGQGTVYTTCPSNATTTAPTTTVPTTTIAPLTQNATQNSTSNSTPSTTTLITTVSTVATTTASTSAYPNCNTCPSGTYYSTNAPTYWNCYGSGALCTYTGSASNGDVGSIGDAAMGILVIIALALLVMMKALPTRLVIVGTALILIGTVAWLLGDYGGPASYVTYGIAAIALGVIVWLYGDMIGGTFKNKKAGMFVGIGVLLIILGTLAWIYLSSVEGIYVGVAGLVIGTIVWLYADKIVGAFIMAKKK